MFATLATAGHLFADSFAIGPLKIVPFGLPLSSFNITAALSSKDILVPSGRRYSFLCLTIIAKTTLSLSHEINNPLMIMRGNIEVLQSDIEDRGSKLQLDEIKRRISKIKEHCNRISEATDKLLNITKPVETVVHGDIKMIDLNS